MNSADFMRGKLEAMKEINEIVGSKIQHAENYKMAKFMHDTSQEIGVLWGAYLKEFSVSLGIEREKNYVSVSR